MDIGLLLCCEEQRNLHFLGGLPGAHCKLIDDFFSGDDACHIGDNLLFFLIRSDNAFESHPTLRGNNLHVVGIERQAFVGDNRFANPFARNVIRITNWLTIKSIRVAPSLRRFTLGRMGTIVRRFDATTGTTNCKRGIGDRMRDTHGSTFLRGPIPGYVTSSLAVSKM
jgi:hypothetical protein